MEFNYLEVYEKVKTHLLTQGKRAMQPRILGNLCAYRGEGDVTCAIGCLMPDDLYDEDIEGKSVENDEVQECLPYGNLNFDKIMFLSSLQKIHDFTLISDWELELNNLKDIYKNLLYQTT